MGSRDVQRLFAEAPFDGVRPEYVRIVRYQYEFTNSETRAATGNWWQRQFRDNYQTPMRLSVKVERGGQGLQDPAW